MAKIFVLSGTCNEVIDRKTNRQNLYFSSIAKVVHHLCDTLSLPFNESTVIDAPLPVSAETTAEYWKIERDHVRPKSETTRTSFRMPLPLTEEGYQPGTRYLVYYDTNTDTSYVVDVETLQ